MNFNSLDKFNEKRKHLLFSLVIVAIICAIVFVGLLQGLVSLISWIARLIVKHWVKILIGVIVLIVLKKFLFRKKLPVQEMRIVR